MSTVVRNLRDGSLVINDGSASPKSCELTLDTGDLSWTETENTTEILDRGRIAGGQIRDGNDAPVELSFSTRWNQLLGFTEEETDPHFLYEMVNNIGGGYTSTFGCGKYTLEYVFTVDDPCGDAIEIVTFAFVYKTTLECGEGEEFNTINFSGRDWEVRPTIERGDAGSA